MPPRRRAPRLHGIPQQPRGDTGGRRRRNAEDANRKHMSASEKAPVSREGRILGGVVVVVGGGANIATAHVLACTHTHTKGFVRTRPRKRGRCRTCHLFSASAGSPFKYPGHSVTGEEGWGLGRGWGDVAGILQ